MLDTTATHTPTNSKNTKDKEKEELEAELHKRIQKMDSEYGVSRPTETSTTERESYRTVRDRESTMTRRTTT